MLNNPKDLPIAENNEISRDNEDNELLDAFIGRVIESSLIKMSNDKDFMKSVMEEHVESVDGVVMDDGDMIVRGGEAD